jgi:hypothetical protein
LSCHQILDNNSLDARPGKVLSPTAVRSCGKVDDHIFNRLPFPRSDENRPRIANRQLADNTNQSSSILIFDMATPSAIPTNSSRDTVQRIHRVTREKRSLWYQLSVLQQPERARACGAGSKGKTDILNTTTSREPMLD